jgi:hypothetical protein
MLFNRSPLAAFVHMFQDHLAGSVAPYHEAFEKSPGKVATPALHYDVRGDSGDVVLSVVRPAETGHPSADGRSFEFELVLYEPFDNPLPYQDFELKLTLETPSGAGTNNRQRSILYQCKHYYSTLPNGPERNAVMAAMICYYWCLHGDQPESTAWVSRHFDDAQASAADRAHHDD